MGKSSLDSVLYQYEPPLFTGCGALLHPKWILQIRNWCRADRAQSKKLNPDDRSSWWRKETANLWMY